jgi:hypothetical protein
MHDDLRHAIPEDHGAGDNEGQLSNELHLYTSAHDFSIQSTISAMAGNSIVAGGGN